MNLVQRAVSNGGRLVPLVIPASESGGMGLMNPSIFRDEDGDLLLNLRHVGYTLYHAENKQMFPTIWGVLAYLHPENDLRLVTTNYLCRLNDDLQITDYTKVDTSKCDVPPLWEFVGQEDCRVVQWNGFLYLVGVRRDTTPTGVGRMEYSRILLDKKKWTAHEVNRNRVPAPPPDDSYCEKNWVPVVDRPYHFIKWTLPTELVKSDSYVEKTSTVFVKKSSPLSHDQRGGSQLIRWGSCYISITHEVDLIKNYLNQKDAFYRHRLILWDDQLNVIGHSNPFTFLDARIEFCVGAVEHQGDLVLTFGFQDNAAFALQVPKGVVEDILLEALANAAV